MNSSVAVEGKAAKYDRALILVAAPPASGKSFIAHKLAEMLGNCTYLDLDSLNSVSKLVCAVQGLPFDKGGDYFKKNVREPEYQALFSLIWETLPYSRVVIASAPFTKEFREQARFSKLAGKAEAYGARLIPIWVLSDVETCRKNMLERAAERDLPKSSNFSAYTDSVDFSRPDVVPAEYQIDNRVRSRWQRDLLRIASELRREFKWESEGETAP